MYDSAQSFNKAKISNSNSICNMNTPKGTEGVNEQGGVEIKVDTVDFRSPAGEDKEAVKEKVQVLHEINDGGANSENTGAPGFVGKAATAVADTFQSAKDAVSGHNTTK